jgi:glucose-6-phosphate 1-dehydrogenase
VPFYLRTGKRGSRSAEITINFKPIPYSIFGNGQGPMRSSGDFFAAGRKRQLL